MPCIWSRKIVRKDPFFSHSKKSGTLLWRDGCGTLIFWVPGYELNPTIHSVAFNWCPAALTFYLGHYQIKDISVSLITAACISYSCIWTKQYWQKEHFGLFVDKGCVRHSRYLLFGGKHSLFYKKRNAFSKTFEVLVSSMKNYCYF